MTVHFVCTGNSYRSRLAETYLNSKKINNIKAISSGINTDQTISWIALRIIQNNKLFSHLSASCQQTTGKLLKKGDFTVFMEEKHYKFCENLGFLSNNFEIWGIHDLLPEMSEEEKIKQSDKTFAEIKKKVDKLVSRVN